MGKYDAVFETLGMGAKKSALALQQADSAKKNAVLEAMAKALLANEARILEANEVDLTKAQENGLPSIMMDRLRLTKERIAQMAQGVLEVTALPDPVSCLLEEIKRPNGLVIHKVAVPLGVIAIIYEARPNVTVDAAALCLKTGNAVILRGGKEALESNKVMVQILREAIGEAGLPADVLQLVEITDREAVSDLLRQRRFIDVVIPRGGAGLIKRIVEESSIPVIETGSGVCHVYVDKAADSTKVVPIVINAKVQRPSVCNSAETLLVHKDVAARFMPELVKALRENQVQLIGDKTVQTYDATAKAAEDINWHTEYNDLIMNVKVVDSVEEAVLHINTYGTKHSECIITEDKTTADFFTTAVDAAAVYVNASTRFTDGFEFGFGAEIGISTQKLHARGPMGLPELTSYKYIIRGEGQIR